MTKTKTKTTINKIFICIYLFLFLLFITGLYISPTTIQMLFTSFVGVGILMFSIAFITWLVPSFGFGLLMVFIVLYLSISLSSSKKESFQMNDLAEQDNIVLKNGWTLELYVDFLKYQSSYNPLYNFDMNIIQQQVTPEEVTEYLQTGQWKWSQEIINIYRSTIETDPYRSFNPYSAVENARRVYNETAIKEILAWDTKEGRFILNGVSIGHTPDLPENMNNTIRCSKDGIPVQMTNVRANGGTNGYVVQKYTEVDPEQLPTLIDGFTFLKEPCNPCSILNEDILTYNCPFSLNIGDGGTVSTIWAYLWDIVPPQTKPIYMKKPSSGVSVSTNLFLNNKESLYMQEYQLDSTKYTKKSNRKKKKNQNINYINTNF
jgi:hypothetical protein